MPAYLRSFVENKLNGCLLQVGVEEKDLSRASLTEPSNSEHGDFSTNAALVFARFLKSNPLELASRIVELLESDQNRYIRKVDLAKPGFVNIWVNDQYFQDNLREILEHEGHYGKPDTLYSEKILVEFVSANPTGPLHLGNGWFGAYGDSVARMLRFSGHNVITEYYVNDTGGQIRALGSTILAIRSGKDVPEDGYKGDYVKNLAMNYSGKEDISEAGQYAVNEIMKIIQNTLKKLNINFDSFFSQASIEEGGVVDEVVEFLRQKNLIFQKDGALWFNSEKLGDTRDRVIVKSNGDVTYTGGDLAYHWNKFMIRKFDRVIDVFGADHHGQVATLKAAALAFGIDPEKLEIKLGQMISLAGEKMSKRAGNFVQLEELIDEYGADEIRFFTLMSSLDQAVSIDINQMKAQSMENPFYYVNYAYARICSLMRHLNTDMSYLRDVDLSSLSEPQEVNLLKSLERFPYELRDATRERAPHRVIAWMRNTASLFHKFYHDLPILKSDPAIRDARLALAEGTRITLKTAFDLVGIIPKESM